MFLGFEYDYPFLDETSGLTFGKKSVTPLYKYMVNIHQPTMVFMGLVVRACVVVAIDTQVGIFPLAQNSENKRQIVETKGDYFIMRNDTELIY